MVMRRSSIEAKKVLCVGKVRQSGLTIPRMSIATDDQGITHG